MSSSFFCVRFWGFNGLGGVGGWGDGVWGEGVCVRERG